MAHELVVRLAQVDVFHHRAPFIASTESERIDSIYAGFRFVANPISFLSIPDGRSNRRGRLGNFAMVIAGPARAQMRLNQ